MYPAHKTSLIEALTDLSHVIYPVMDAETIATLPIDVLFHYNQRPEHEQKAFIEYVQIDIVIDRFDDALSSWNEIAGVFLDLGEYEYVRDGTDDFLIDVRFHLAKMLDERAAIMGWEKVDPMAYLDGAAFQPDGDAIEWQRCFDRGIKKLGERLAQERAVSDAKAVAAIDLEYPRQAE